MQTRDFELASWQQQAVEAWLAGDGNEPGHGTLEIVTGGGKTLIALSCAARISEKSPDLRIAVVVPTEALARQWISALERWTTLQRPEIGLLGAGGRDDFQDRRVLVAVLNTAAKRLPTLARNAQPLMLIVDECHRAGAPAFARVLDTPARYRLGLSATPDREELDDDGEPLSYDEQRVGQSLGSVVFTFDLRAARTQGWLPDYEIHHHGVQLNPEEHQTYEKLSRRVDDLADQLRGLGVDASRSSQYQSRGGDVGQTAKAYVAATSQRKDLLYRATERHRVTGYLVRDALGALPPRRVLLFHERVGEAEALYHQLSEATSGSLIGLEHSRLPTGIRNQALDAFRKGTIPVLVSVKSLIEGIDVPEADVGISVASTSSIRQRIQSLGRVLRRSFDTTAPTKHATMHLIYVHDTVDAFIYARQDWSDLTGHGANHFWKWPLGAEHPDPADGPPASPRPTEEQEWQRLGSAAPANPEPWLGVPAGQEYSVDTLGTVTNAFGTVIANPQHAAEMVEAVRRRPGGRFRVTPAHRLVLVWGDGTDGPTWLVAGQLSEAFKGVPDEPKEITNSPDPTHLQPGDPYVGTPDKSGGTYSLRQKQGGVIERKGSARSTEFALEVGSDDPNLEHNATRVLAAWRQLFDRGITFYLTEDGIAWYLDAGKRHFLAKVDGGFAWPPPMKEK